ncbi:MAG: Mrp/NBP35 family ATP-binding protein [Lachnospiraceae bacterium]|nr:Mrp/NBP35 family ATP-binding protein [Lachnospiraceae bacterium]
MSEECSHNCSECGSDCTDRTAPQSFLAQANEASNVRKVIGIVSGKGGVGKSLVTSLLACSMLKKGFTAAILDADITGPSIPKMFGIQEKAYANDLGIEPVNTKSGIRIMSLNLLLENDTDPVIWRGPMIAGVVKQFWTDVCWGDVDYMFVDMPPGTGDVPLTVFQSLPVDGIIVVTSPQELVGMIVGKAVNMAEAMNIPVLGIVENMSYFECPSCHEKHYIFGDSHIEEMAALYGIAHVARIPIVPEIAAACDSGEVEAINLSSLQELTDILEEE